MLAATSLLCPLSLFLSTLWLMCKRNKVETTNNSGEDDGLRSPVCVLSICQACRFQFSSVTQLCPTLQLHGLQHARLPCLSPTLELSQTHVHWVGDAIQPSHPLLPSFPPALNLSQGQGLFNESAVCIRRPKVLELQLQHQSVNSTFNFLRNSQAIFPSGYTRNIWGLQSLLTLINS